MRHTNKLCNFSNRRGKFHHLSHRKLWQGVTLPNTLSRYPWGWCASPSGDERVGRLSAVQTAFPGFLIPILTSVSRKESL